MSTLLPAHSLTARHGRPDADRVDAGIYGLCEGCQEVIDAGRLRALPTARLCALCQLDLRSGPIPSLQSRSAIRRGPRVSCLGPAGR
jgi:hypothetical protein